MIRAGLERLRSAKRSPKVFGAEAHGFKLHAPLTEAAVRKFEIEHRVRLPQDYRRFLIELGNGGAGPFYGVFKFGEMDDGFEFKKWKSGDGFVGDLSRPFPHRKPWNDLTGEPDDTLGDDEYEEALEVFDEHYWNPAQVNGAIPICHEGCACRDWLVVKGPEAGHIWHDARTDRKGLRPISHRKKRRVTFLEWYVAWLNDALDKLRSARGRG
jgi:hypothetical protein